METLNGFTIVANGQDNELEVILGVRELTFDSPRFEYVVARRVPGATSWVQGHYTNDISHAVEMFREMLRCPHT